MARYVQKLSFGIDDREWWVGWEIAGPVRNISGLIPVDSMAPEDLRSTGVSSFQPVTPDMLTRLERRTVPRIRLPKPFPGKVEALDVQVVDLSAGGIGISHRQPLRPGRVIHVDFMAADQFYSMKYELLRCQLSRGVVGHGEPHYYSALRLRSIKPDDRNSLALLVSNILSSNGPSICDNPRQLLAMD